MHVIRYALPVAVVLADVVVMGFGGTVDLEGGAGILGAGLAIYAVNWLFRIGASGDRERDDEEAARDYLDRHGRWPS